MKKFIFLGDKTTCGGFVTSGVSCLFTEGKNIAAMSSTVTCGKDGKVYSIIEGVLLQIYYHLHFNLH